MVSFKRWNLGIQKNPFRVVFLVSPVSRGLCGAGTMLGLSLKALAMRGLSPVALSGPTLQLWCLGFPSWRLLFLQNTGSGAPRLQQLWCLGLVALRHVGSFWARDGTRVSCISRGILNHWTTSEAQAEDSREAFPEVCAMKKNNNSATCINQ